MEQHSVVGKCVDGIGVSGIGKEREAHFEQSNQDEQDDVNLFAVVGCEVVGCIYLA